MVIALIAQGKSILEREFARLPKTQMLRTRVVAGSRALPFQAILVLRQGENVSHDARFLSGAW
jgi:hypothetical protein